jgi:transcriptional regulator with XRE-family HTH domain
MKVNQSMPNRSPTSKELATVFGERLRELRIQKGDLSQEKLADNVGVHRSFIGRVERGESNITLANLYRICTGLGVTLSEFFKDFESNTTTSNNG